MKKVILGKTEYFTTNINGTDLYSYTEEGLKETIKAFKDIYKV